GEGLVLHRWQQDPPEGRFSYRREAISSAGGPRTSWARRTPWPTWLFLTQPSQPPPREPDARPLPSQYGRNPVLEEPAMTTQLDRTPTNGLAPQARSHPLDPLSAQEIRSAAAILRRSRDLGPALRFVMISLLEPPKPAGLDFSLGPVPDRAAFIVTYDRSEKMIY